MAVSSSSADTAPAIVSPERLLALLSAAHAFNHAQAELMPLVYLASLLG
jgi:hypothetical protein